MLIQKFIREIKKNQCILISYSGGLDSTVLLYQLIPFIKKFPFIKVRAIHINHQINIQSDVWSQHCKKICQKNNISLIIKKIFFKNKKNFQETARTLRYKTILKNILPNEILVTAHHLNDQCETLFLAFKRASGNSGLSGIAYSKNIDIKKKIFRPLLQYPKKTLLKWAKLNNIQWIEDDSNQKNIYDRNFIRNIIIKPIEKKWPFFLQNCNNSMNFFYNQEKSLNYFLDIILTNHSLFKNMLNIKKIQKYIKEIKILLIRRWIFLQKNQILSYQKTKEIYKNFFNNHKNHTKYKIQINKHEICQYKNIIYHIPIYPTLKNTILFWHNKNQTIMLPNNLGQIKQNKYGISLPLPKKTDIINIRFQTCKRIAINPIYKKKIKNIWQENNIPPWNRNRIPIIFYNNTIIAIFGIITFFNFNIKKKNQIWQVAWENYIKKNY